MITQDRVRELFEYRDGLLIRKGKTANSVKIGEIAGYDNDGRGYLSLRVDKRRWKVHRIIWLWHYGYYPENGIDHINRNKSDNRIENLREVSRQCNMRNVGLQSRNTSGVKGISFENQTHMWKAQIRVGDKCVNLGRAVCFLEAVCLRLAAEQALGWDGCDSSSTAFVYVNNNINKQHGDVDYL